MTKEIITQDYVKQLFEYRDGELFWKVSVGKAKVGKKAGSLKLNGYFNTGINGKVYRNHRLVFLMHHGYLPKCVDHIDGNCLNNKIENLREATHSQNSQNGKFRTNNTSSAKGVFWSKKFNKWVIQISINNKHKYFGMYKDLELADLVAQEARDKYHGAFANHGR